GGGGNTMSTPVYQSGSGFEDTLMGVNFKNKLNYANNSYFVFGYEFAHHDAKRKSVVHYSVNSTMPPNGFSMSHTMTTLMDMDKQSHSFYMLDSHEFNDFFSLSGGTRYEFSLYDTNRNYNSNMMMNMGRPTNTNTKEFFNTDDTSHNLAFELTPNFTYSNTGKIYAKYERGFISPSPSQLVNKDQKNKSYYSADLDPEIFHTFELGIDDFWWDFYGFNLSVFYTLSKDEISYLGDPHATAGAFWKYYNIDETRRLGAELNLSQSFLDESLILKQGLTYLDAKISKGINDGLRIPYVSKIKALAGVEFAFNPNFSSFVDLTYFSRAKDGGKIDDKTGKMSQNAWIKDYFLSDVGVNYHYKQLQVLAGIRNLFDQKYYTYQNSASNQYLVGNGRNYYVEFKYIF
ncbi:TonB-dependent receptor, partial [Campylobacter upsaliensis]|uniref:TonB-dependent receptor n=1 Tax=Campylobacter upsaliensis TaxID=28080 RepID=UPI00214A4F9B